MEAPWATFQSLRLNVGLYRLGEAGKSLVCVKPFNGNDYRGDAYLLNDIGRFTANDFMLLLQNTTLAIEVR